MKPYLFFAFIGVFSLSLFLNGCSSNTPAPIYDRSSSAKNTTAPQNSTNANSSAVKVNPVPMPKPIVQKNPPKESPKPEARVDTTKAITPTDNGFKLLKPTTAPVVTPFNDVSNKGIDFAGKMGDAVLAAADGKVIYSGNNLRTYGNLIIVNHSNGYVTVYANNKTLFVKEGESVKRGQKIAEMGNSESDRVKLHFELRKNSKPIDPSSYFAEN